MPPMVAALTTEQEICVAVKAVTNATCPGGLPVLLAMLESPSESIRLDAHTKLEFLINRLGSAFAVGANEAGLIQALFRAFLSRATEP